MSALTGILPLDNNILGDLAEGLVGGVMGTVLCLFQAVFALFGDLNGELKNMIAGVNSLLGCLTTQTLGELGPLTNTAALLKYVPIIVTCITAVLGPLGSILSTALPGIGIFAAGLINGAVSTLTGLSGTLTTMIGSGGVTSFGK